MGKSRRITRLCRSETYRKNYCKSSRGRAERRISTKKISGVAYYQIDTEALAIHEVMLELKNAGMSDIELKVTDSWRTEDLPEDWFDDYTFEIEFSGVIDCSADEFLKNATCVDEIDYKGE